MYNKLTDPSARRQIGTNTAESFEGPLSLLLSDCFFLGGLNDGSFLNSEMQYLRCSEHNNSASSDIVIFLKLN